MISPIAETFHMIAGASESYRSHLLTAPDEQPGWITIAELTALDHPRLPAALANAKLHFKAAQKDRQSTASLWIGHYAFYIMAGAIACYLATQRVPDLSLSSISIRFDEDGETAATSWHSPRFAALASDPAAAHPDCTPFATLDELRQHLCTEFNNHFTPVIDALRRHSAMGKVGMWAIAADTCAGAFTWVAERLGRPEFGLSEARAFAALPSRLGRSRDFVQIEEAGFVYQLVDRGSCCLFYKVEEGEYCSNCPHRPMQERVELIKSWLHERAAEEKAEA
jgi:ferric iron reductase protein FhuF